MRFTANDFAFVPLVDIISACGAKNAVFKGSVAVAVMDATNAPVSEFCNSIRISELFGVQ